MKKYLEIDNINIDIITDQEVNGRGFLHLNEEKLMQDSLKRSPAETIAGFIEKINGQQGDQ